MLDTEIEASGPVAYGPPPAWADIPEGLPLTRPSAQQSIGGRSIWLSDSQVNILGDNQVYLYRSVNEVISPDGLQAAANLDISFDPSFQRLVIHHVRVNRSGVTRDVNPLVGLELLRRERDMERAILDGRLTAHLSIPDVRVGDVVDTCYTLDGGHPMLGGRFCAEWMLSWGCWVGETRIRVVAPADRPLTIKTWNDAPQCEIQTTGSGEIVRSWRTRMTPPVVMEPFVPSWVRQFAGVRVCDPISWADVAKTFRPFYSPEPLPDELESTAREIEQQANNKAGRVIAALRLVQNGLRYQALNIGDGGFAPRPVDTIWRSRMGDCKDASRLLTALLSRLGIQAEPVLVNTQRGQVLDDEPPSLTAFNHCIVGVTVDGRRYWLDPTLFPQGGGLDVVRQVRFGWCLPLSAAALEDMGEDPLADSFHICETYDLPKQIAFSGKLVTKTTFFGWRADLIRRKLANGQDAYVEERLTGQRQRYGSARALEPLQIEDDLEANRLELVETVELGRVWTIGSDGRAIFEPADTFFHPNIPILTQENRRWPVALGMPLRASSRIEIHSPVPAPPRPWDIVVNKPGLLAASKFGRADHKDKFLILERRLVYERTTLKAEEAGILNNIRNDIGGKSMIAVRLPCRNGAVFSPQNKKKITPIRFIIWIFWLLWIIFMLLRGASSVTGAH